MIPLVQTEGESFLRRPDAVVIRGISLIPLSEVDTRVVGGYSDKVSATDVLTKLDTLVAFHHGFDVFIDVVYDFTKCSPSITSKQTNGFRSNREIGRDREMDKYWMITKSNATSLNVGIKNKLKIKRTFWV